MSSDRFRRLDTESMPVIDHMIADGYIAVPESVFRNSLFTEIEFACIDDVERVDTLLHLGLI